MRCVGQLLRRSGVYLAFAGWLSFTMLSLSPSHADEPPFSADDVLSGVAPENCQGSGRIQVMADGQGDCLRFYGA